MGLVYGAIADSRGRKFVLSLSILGQAFALLWIMLMCWSERFTCLGWADN